MDWQSLLEKRAKQSIQTCRAAFQFDNFATYSKAVSSKAGQTAPINGSPVAAMFFGNWKWQTVSSRNRRSASRNTLAG